jgi:predicted protein tyrosine phosphatase
MNRLHNLSNPHQGSYKRVLTVCSAGLLRSPTAAWVLSQEPYNYNTRAAGSEVDFALIPVDEALLAWAQEVVFMTEGHYTTVVDQFGLERVKNPMVLDIPDRFGYREQELVDAIRDTYDYLKKEEHAHLRV